MRVNPNIIIILLSAILLLSSCASGSNQPLGPSSNKSIQRGSDSKSKQPVSDMSDSISAEEQEKEYTGYEQLDGLGYIEDGTAWDSDSSGELPADEPTISARRMVFDKEQIEAAHEGFAVGKAQEEPAEEADSIVADELNAPGGIHFERLEKKTDEAELKEKDKGSGGFGGGGGGGRSKRDDSRIEALAGAIDPAAPKPEKAETERANEVSLQEFRIRSRFPEIIFYHPNLITDINGETGFTFPAQDAITEYAIDIHAASQDGEWGYGQSTFKTFQPFFIEFNPPTRIYTNDKLELNAAIFNYLDKPLTVKISAIISGGISLDTESFSPITVNAKTVVDYPITILANEIGRASITLTAVSSDTTDSLRRSINVLPDYPEKLLNEEGMLKSGGGVIEIQIPQDAEIMPDNFTLRILSDTTLGALSHLRELESEPHGSLTRSLSMWLSAITAYEQLNNRSLLTDDLKNELTRSIDSAWLRILAFRHETGFSFFPGDMSDTSDIANIIILDSFHKVDSKYIYDQKLLDQMEFLVTVVFETKSNPLNDRLYAACVLTESDKIDPYIKKRIIEFLKSPQVSLSSDLNAIALSSRCSASLGQKVDFNKADKLFESWTAMQNVQSSGAPLSGFSTIAAYSSVSNHLNFLTAFNNVQSPLNPSQTMIKSRIFSVVKNAAFSSEVSPLERSYARLQLLDSKETGSMMGKVDSVIINGSSYDLDDDSSSLEIPISLNPGKNTIKIKTQENISYYQIMGRYYQKSKSGKSDIIDYSFPRKPDQDMTFNAKLTIYDPEAVFKKESIIRLPLPCGVKPIDSPTVLAKRLGASYAEIRTNEIILYYNNIKSKPFYANNIPMKAAFNGEFFLPPPEVINISGQIENSNSTGSHIKWL